jgi:uncharacterized RDD family membrane protein YckC
MYCQACGTPIQPKPKPVANVTAGTDVTYAGFWARFVAMIIDGLIVWVVGGLIVAATFGVGIVVLLFGRWLYEAFMLSSEWQATVGKRAMSIAVTDVDGRRISFARATARHFAKLISWPLTLGIGFIMVAFTSRKQALHDMIAETLVVNRVL